MERRGAIGVGAYESRCARPIFLCMELVHLREGLVASSAGLALSFVPGGVFWDVS